MITDQQDQCRLRQTFRISCGPKSEAQVLIFRITRGSRSAWADLSHRLVCRRARQRLRPDGRIIARDGARNPNRAGNRIC